MKIDATHHSRAHGGHRGYSEIWGILLHSTEGYPDGDLGILTRSESVSAHYLIQPDGTIYNLVPPTVVAYHAGRGILAGHVLNLNHGLIGIEMSNPSSPGHSYPYPVVQLEALDFLIKFLDELLGRRVAIWGHKDVIRLPGRWRKTDPDGPFPLANYKRWRRHAPVDFHVWVGNFARTRLVRILDKLAAMHGARYDRKPTKMRRKDRDLTSFSPAGAYKGKPVESMRIGPVGLAEAKQLRRRIVWRCGLLLVPRKVRIL